MKVLLTYAMVAAMAAFVCLVSSTAFGRAGGGAGHFGGASMMNGAMGFRSGGFGHSLAPSQFHSFAPRNMMGGNGFLGPTTGMGGVRHSSSSSSVSHAFIASSQNGGQQNNAQNGGPLGQFVKHPGRRSSAASQPETKPPKSFGNNDGSLGADSKHFGPAFGPGNGNDQPFFGNGSHEKGFFGTGGIGQGPFSGGAEHKMGFNNFNGHNNWWGQGNAWHHNDDHWGHDGHHFFVHDCDDFFHTSFFLGGCAFPPCGFFGGGFGVTAPVVVFGGYSPFYNGGYGAGYNPCYFNGYSWVCPPVGWNSGYYPDYGAVAPFDTVQGPTYAPAVPSQSDGGVYLGSYSTYSDDACSVLAQSCSAAPGPVSAFSIFQ
jgi:hypothetical protein